MRQKTEIESRFWDKVAIPRDPYDCWEWAAARRNGYGVIGRPGQRGGVAYAHRWVYEHFYEFVPAGMDVCHTCNNRACVNPYHLYEGSRRDNMQQARRQGRLKRKYKPWSPARRARHEARKEERA